MDSPDSDSHAELLANLRMSGADSHVEVLANSVRRSGSFAPRNQVHSTRALPSLPQNESHLPVPPFSVPAAVRAFTTTKAATGHECVPSSAPTPQPSGLPSHSPLRLVTADPHINFEHSETGDRPRQTARRYSPQRQPPQLNARPPSPRAFFQIIYRHYGLWDLFAL